jgi:hypothetical protein
MATAVRRLVVFLLVARAVIGVPLLVLLVIGLGGLGGIANPSDSHASRVMFGLRFEAIAEIAGIVFALYISGRPTNSPRLNAFVLMAFGPSLIPFWFIFPIAKANPAIVWGVVVGTIACGAVAMVWPYKMTERTPMVVRGHAERSEEPVNPTKPT